MPLYLRKTWWTTAGSSPEFWENALPDGETLAVELEGISDSQTAQVLAKGIQQGARVLDAGCGPMLWAHLCKKQGASYIGLDYSQNLLRRGIDWTKQAAVRSSVWELPFSGNSFDVYISLGVLEHRQEGMQPGLHEAARVLRPGGLAYISVPYMSWIRLAFLPFDTFWGRLKRWNWLRHLLGKRRVSDPVFYQYAYTLAELRRQVADAGMTVRDVQPTHLESGLMRDRRTLRWLKRRMPGAFNWILRLMTQISPHSCAHMVLITVVRTG